MKLNSREEEDFFHVRTGFEKQPFSSIVTFRSCRMRGVYRSMTLRQSNAFGVEVNVW
jgi:hypothetical protein